MAQVGTEARRLQAERARATVAAMLSDQKVVIGRTHIRGDRASGNMSRRVGLWDINTKPGTTLDKVKVVYLGGLSLADASEAFGNEARSSGRYTEDGLKAALLDHGAGKLAVQLKRHQQTIDRARRELSDQKAKLAPPTPDPSDAAGAIRRWEFRQWFRGLSDRERSRYMLENRDKMNPEEAQALMEVPASRTGIMEMDRNDLIDRAIRAAHGDSAIEDVQALEKGIELAAAANEAAREQIAEDGGATVAQFDEAAAPFEARASVPWLRKEKDKVYAMDVARKSWAPATDEQVSAGDYFPTWDQFNQENGREAGARFE